MTTELTDNERALLAREVAADAAGWVETCRSAFISGWNAAMAHVAEQAAEGIGHLKDNDDCCHFQD